MLRKVVMFLAVMVIGATGCRVKEKPPPFLVVDVESELAALQGAWKIHDLDLKFRGLTTWTFKGNQLTRTKDDRSETCQVEFPTPGKLRCVGPGEHGLKSVAEYAYARNGKTVYLGGGAAGVKLADRWVITISHGNVLVLADGKCTFFERDIGSNPYTTGRPDCTYELKTIDGTQKITYQAPDTEKVGAVEKETLIVDGDAVVNKYLKKAAKDSQD